MTKHPILYHKGKKGETRQWRVWADNNKVWTEHGTHGGKLVTNSKVCFVTNEGRSNERSAREQAIFEAEALHQHKLSRKYSTTIEETEKILDTIPMKCQAYHVKKKDSTYKLTNHGKKVPWPVSLQPKLDGYRVTARWENNAIVFKSSQGRIYEMPTIEKELQAWLPKNWILDGEAYIHGMELQDISRLVKKVRPGSEKLEYHVFDRIDVLSPGENWKTRSASLYSKAFKVSAHVVTVPVESVKNHEEAIESTARYTGLAFEGSILRAPLGTYEWGYRSSSVLKLKEFEDDEFVLLDVIPGQGDIGIFVLKNNNNTDTTFKATPKATTEMKRLLLKHKDKMIGQRVTVRFQHRSKDGIPTGNTVAVAFRLPEDLDQ